MKTSITAELLDAAQDKEKVSGLTHNFYRYPARFSPRFARAAINAFSLPGDTILDPYVGGGTTVVEAIAAGRHAYGTDLNSLAVFVATVKTTILNGKQMDEVWAWVDRSSRGMSFRANGERLRHILEDPKTRNLTLPIARPTKKGMAAAIMEIATIQDAQAQDFARCVLLRTAQWALDGRRCVPSLEDVRVKVRSFTAEMLLGLKDLDGRITKSSLAKPKCVIVESDAACLLNAPCFATGDVKADLIVTSPPYPGVHVLYHRWQVNGRRETPAPYWITNCNDGQGAAFYNFGDRRGGGLKKYFKSSLDTLLTVRRLVKDGGKIVQLVAFSDPGVQLPLYLQNMRLAGFEEVPLPGCSRQRIWRDVPSRKWHAALKGRTSSSREVVLIHQAI